MPPHSLPEGFSTPANCADCRSSIRQGSHSFYLASLLLPIEIREPAYAVYAFCRMADDLIDREGEGEDGVTLLAGMLDRIYAGRPQASYVERGFADVVNRFAIPRAVPDALIEGLAWDVAGRRYETLDDLVAYAVRVAGTVGFMMTLVMGRREPHVLARACDLGVAMQLTNIARDIGEDAATGRIYMPLTWLRQNGVDPDAWCAAPAYLPPVRVAVKRLLDEAEIYYQRSLPGIAALPGSARLGIDVARLLYREIGRKIERGVDPVTTRARTSRNEKLALVAKAAVSGTRQAEGLEAAAVPAAHFLLEAVASSPVAVRLRELPPWWDVIARTRRMMDLLVAFSARAAVAESAPPARLRSGQIQPAGRSA